MLRVSNFEVTEFAAVMLPSGAKVGDEFTFWDATAAPMRVDFKQMSFPSFPGFYWDTTAATHTTWLRKRMHSPGLNNFSGDC